MEIVGAPILIQGYASGSFWRLSERTPVMHAKVAQISMQHLALVRFKIKAILTYK